MVYRVKDIWPGSGSGNVRGLTAVGSRVFFSANNGSIGEELWQSDGTEAGTVNVADLLLGPSSSVPGLTTILAFGGGITFTARNTGSADFLWFANGAGAFPIPSLTPGDNISRGLIAIQGAVPELYSVNPGGDLFRIPFGLGTPIAVTAPGGGALNASGTTPYQFAVTPSELYFLGSGGIWMTSGGISSRVAGYFDPGSPLPGVVLSLTTVGRRLYYAIQEGPDISLWHFDPMSGLLPGRLRTFGSYAELGSRGGTTPMTAAVGDELYFYAESGTRQELWKSNGTAAGTILVRDIGSSLGVSVKPAFFTPVVLPDSSRRLYFVANDGLTGHELWRSDGTAAGTRSITDISPGSVSSSPTDLVVFGTNLYFTAMDPVNGRQLWTLDLLTERLTQLTKFRLWGETSQFSIEAPAGGDGSVKNMTLAGETLFFSASYANYTGSSLTTVVEGHELWALDLSPSRPPRVLGATAVNSSAGVRVILQLSEPVLLTDTTPASLMTRFNVTVGGGGRTVTGVGFVPGFTNRVELTLSGLPIPSPGRGHQSVVVSYTDPAGNDAAGVIQDLAGHDMLGFSGLTVDTLRSAFDVTVLNASYRDLVLTTDPLMPPARIGTGNANSNTITVNQPVAVDNVIDGRGGVDTMDGGLGNDIYLVTDPTHHAVGEVNDSGGDAEDELRFAGIAPGTLQVFSNDIGLDKVTIGTGTGPTPIPTALALNIDASAAPNGLRIFGSTGANMLRGSQHPDLLEGGDGVDRMEGGIGNDVYVVNRQLHHGAPEIWDVSGTTDELRFTSTTPGDILVVQRGLGVGGTAGIEQVVIRDDLIPTTSMGTGIGTHQLGIDARQSVEALTIMGNAGRNIIWGTPLVDRLNGGPGNDLYMIPSAAHHAAAEINDGSGVDELRFSQTSTLGEPDTLTLFAGDTGLETVNIATGTSPTPNFTGTTALNVDATAVLTSLSITGNNGPNRILGTALADTLTGNAGNDSLRGGAGSDTLIGGNGSDRLWGETGADSFLFNVAPSIANVDWIEDFGAGDELVLSRTVFGGLPAGAALPASAFVVGSIATTLDHRVIYDPVGVPDRRLRYDPDGTGPMPISGPFAYLVGAPPLDHTRFRIVV